VNVERRPHPSDHQSPPPGLKVIRPSSLARALCAILAALLLAVIGAAAVVGLITFSVFFLLLVPVFLLLFIATLVLGRGRFNVYLIRRFRTPEYRAGRPPGPDRNN
jgi:hypothetical protein